MSEKLILTKEEQDVIAECLSVMGHIVIKYMEKGVVLPKLEGILDAGEKYNIYFNLEGRKKQ